ncbi:hypothetical protein QE152_g24282 [Popillia japonica]|uniref:Uncharacterized protein n=1 Tax=Popillia japonica TaxID=7064 RepID=A0AAW1KCX9_POPJA
MAGSSQQPIQYVLIPLPDSPSSKNFSEHHTKMDVGDDCLNETLTPVSHCRRSPVDYGELSNAEILKHIRLLQQILAKRSVRKSSTRDLRTEFDKEGVRNDSKPKEIKRRGYTFTKAQNVSDCIRLFPSSEADFRGIVKFFTNDNIPFHTYQLPSEKVLNIVFRGVSVEIPEDQIRRQLLELGFTPELVLRMRRNRGGRPMPLVWIKISKEQKKNLPP